MTKIATPTLEQLEIAGIIAGIGVVAYAAYKALNVGSAVDTKVANAVSSLRPSDANPDLPADAAPSNTLDAVGTVIGEWGAKAWLAIAGDKPAVSSGGASFTDSENWPVNYGPGGGTTVFGGVDPSAARVDAVSGDVK